MSEVVSNIRASLHRALDKLGHKNGHQAPESKQNIEPALHELYVSSECAAYFDKRRAIALDAVRQIVGEDAINGVELGSEQIVVNATHYALLVKRARPSKRINRTKVENELRKRGLTDTEVVKFMALCEDETKPATTIKAVGN